MRKKLLRKNPSPGKKHQESVFKEAWENMNEDMSKVLPGFLVKRLQSRKGKTWVMAVIALLEVLILGVAGKFVYDWFMK